MDMDDEIPPGPGAAGEPGQWLLRALLTEPGAMGQALQAYHSYGSGADGVLAARRVLSAVLRRTASWPRDDDYAALADGFTARGDLDAAQLLYDIAVAGPLIVDAADEWSGRYDDRTGTPGQELAGWLSDLGYIDFDPDGPYRGIDGADYQPGVTTNGLREVPVVVVTSRGMREVIGGWRDYEEMRRWVASRGSTGSGDLDPPAAAEASRVVREERVLAHLLNQRRSVPEITAVLPPVTFTADVRYDLYAAMTAAAQMQQPWPYSLFRQEFTRRLARVPGHALAAYGGPDGATAVLYRGRLTDTTVACDQAMSAVVSLREEDRHAVRVRAYQHLAPGTGGLRSAVPLSGHDPAPDAQPPPHIPGPGPAEPRM